MMELFNVARKIGFNSTMLVLYLCLFELRVDIPFSEWRHYEQDWARGALISHLDTEMQIPVEGNCLGDFSSRKHDPVESSHYAPSSGQIN